MGDLESYGILPYNCSSSLRRKEAAMKAHAARLEMRLDLKLKKLIEQAAALQGQPVTSFAMAALVEKAQDVLERHHTTLLTQRDMRAFTKYLGSDPTPTPALRAAVKRLKALGG